MTPLLAYALGFLTPFAITAALAWLVERAMFRGPWGH